MRNSCARRSRIQSINIGRTYSLVSCSLKRVITHCRSIVQSHADPDNQDGCDYRGKDDLPSVSRQGLSALYVRDRALGYLVLQFRHLSRYSVLNLG